MAKAKDEEVPKPAEQPEAEPKDEPEVEPKAATKDEPKDEPEAAPEPPALYRVKHNAVGRWLLGDAITEQNMLDSGTNDPAKAIERLLAMGAIEKVEG